MGKRISTLVGAVAALTATAAGAAPGAWVEGVKPIPTPEGAAGAPLPVTSSALNRTPEPQEGWASDGGQRMVYNIARPALIALTPPAAGDAPRPAVILVPGGGFEFLSMDNEGYQVAERLKRLGVRVFILKYRTLPLPGGFQGFHDAIAFTFAGRPRAQGPIDIQSALPDAMADAEAALRAVRANAKAYGVDAARVGLLGFSAGAVTSLAATEANAPGARPDFVGLIYGPTKAAPVPPNAPPLFAAIAADDRFFGKDDLGLIERWRASGASVEFHLYSGGGHGFASHPMGTTSDHWFDAFAHWLKAKAIVKGG